MRYPSVLIAALAAGFLPVSAVAQAAPAAPAPALPSSPSEQGAAAAQPAPQAFPAKIALIAFEQCVIATNEGQHVLADVQKKYEPKQAQLEALSKEIDSLKTQLQAAPATTTDEQRATRMKTLDSKQKELDRDTDDARNAYQADLQDAYGKVAQKVNAVLVNYVEKNGYTILLDVGSQQSNVMWAAHEPSADITEAVVQAYNASTPNIAAPPPPAPAATTSKPAATPHSTTTKPPSK